MANIITTSVVVQFSQGTSGGVLKVEVDSRDTSDGGLNGGKSSFSPGDTVSLLLYKSTTVTLDHFEASLGAITTQLPTIFTQHTEDLEFVNETEVTLSYPTNAIATVQWLGRNLGSLALSGDSTVRIPAPADGDYAVGVARVTYVSEAQVYVLKHSPLGVAEYPIVCFFLGHSE